MNTDEFEGHTPAPWAYCEDEVYAEGNPIIVALRAHGTKGELTSKLPHRWADFRLIVAAPDLLAFYLRVKEIMDMEEIEEIVRVELIWTVMQEMKE